MPRRRGSCQYHTLTRADAVFAKVSSVFRSASGDIQKAELSTLKSRMIVKPPNAKLKPILKGKLDQSNLHKIHSMAWLNYQLFLFRLARQAADKAREDKSSVITQAHVRAAVYSILGNCRG